jgi:hypothetical protein
MNTPWTELVSVSIVLLSVLTIFLTILVASRFARTRGLPHLFWAIGLALVGATLAEEVLLYEGVWSQPLIQSYLFLIAVLVGILSVGSIETLSSVRIRRGYEAYVAATSVLLGLIAFTTPIEPSILTGGVVTGNPPVATLLASILLTVPGAGVLLVTSLNGAFRLRKWSLLYITAGTAVITAAGGLYVVSIPVTLYYAEFLGVFLLFLGFVSPLRAPAPAPAPAPTAQGTAR